MNLISFSYLFFFVISLQNWNHFPFPAKSSQQVFSMTKQKSIYWELPLPYNNRYCSTKETFTSLDLKLMDPSRKNKHGRLKRPQTRTAWWLNHPTHLKKYAARQIGNHRNSTIFGRNIPNNIRVATNSISSFFLSWCEGVTHLKPPIR